MGFTQKTGGDKEFHYTPEDLKRIENEDTESTVEFKEAYRKWLAEKKNPIAKSINFIKNIPKHHPEKKHHKSKGKKHYHVEHTGRPNKILEAQHKPKKHRKKFSPFLKKSIFLFIFVLLFVATLLFLAYSNETISIVEEKPDTKTVLYNETLTNDIDFSEYLDNPNEYENKQIKFKGFLERHIEGVGNAGVYVESISDDDGKRIELVNLDSTEKNLFPKLGRTEQIYQIEGTFERKYKTLYLKPVTIKPSERDEVGIATKSKKVEYTQEIQRNITKPKYSFFRSLVFNLLGKEVLCEDGAKLNSCSTEKPYYCSLNGLNRNPIKCGCPKGERLYQGECILKVECSDGTLEPECSTNKPKQCVDGNLIDNADLCGCPDDYRKTGDSCKKILRCSDGTEYGYCSTEKPLFCENGNLVNKASKCGCAGGSSIIKDGDECVDALKPPIEKIEKRIHELINVERKNNGLNPLEWNEKIASASRFHSQDMAIRGYFEHDSPDGETFEDRYRMAGFSCRVDAGSFYYTGAENIHQGNLYSTAWYTDGVLTSYDWNTPEKIANDAVQGWMNSPGHRKNILTPSWRTEGIGIAISSNKEVLVTQNFC